MTDNTQKYQWTGINKQGKRLSGAVHANNVKDAEAELKKQDIIVITMTSKKVSSSGWNINLTPVRITQKDILFFTRYLATMLSAGLTIFQALEIILRDQKNPTMHAVITSLKSNISSGKTLSESFGLHVKYFGVLYCGLLKTAEQSGTLDKVLNRLSGYLERAEALRKKIKKAFIYPSAIIVVGIGITFILLTFVVPRFKSLFASGGGKLPYFTEVVISISAVLQAYWWQIIVFVVLGVVLLRWSIKRYPAMLELKDKIMLRLPIVGSVVKNGVIARFTRTLAITLDSGLPLAESLRAMAPIMGNVIYSRAILKVCDEVITGVQLSVAMENTKLFPTLVIQMMSIGEASGRLVDMLNRMADYYEDEVNQSVDNISSLIEPMVMVMLSVIIGGFIIAMYMPIFQMGTMVK